MGLTLSRVMGLEASLLFLDIYFTILVFIVVVIVVFP